MPDFAKIRERVRWQSVWVGLGFFLFAFLVYGASLGNKFVVWDDPYLFVANPYVKGITFSSLKWIFTHFDPELYVPLTFLSYQLDYLIGDGRPWMIHLTNLLLHAANAVLVWRLLERLIANRPIAIGLGLLFLVHPLNTEAVAWGSARKDVLSAFFFLSSLLFYVQCVEMENGKWKIENYFQFFLSLTFFLLGLLTKVSILTLPFVLLLIDDWLGRRWWRFADRQDHRDGSLHRYVDISMQSGFDIRTLLEKIPFFALSLFFGALALFGKIDPIRPMLLWENILMGSKSAVFYVQKFFWPSDLSVLYPYDGAVTIRSVDLAVTLGIVILLVAVAIIARMWERIPGIRGSSFFFGVMFFLITLAPNCTNFAKGGDLYFASDRYAYIPMIGLLFVIGAISRSWLNRALNDRRRQGNDCVFLAGFIGLLGLFGFLSFKQSLTWRDTGALFTQTLRAYPTAIAAPLNLSVVARQRGDYAESLGYLDRAERIRPHILVPIGRAATYETQGKLDEAVIELAKALRIDPNEEHIHVGFGSVYAKLGKPEEAIAAYRRAAEINPLFVTAINNAGGLLLQLGRMEEAKAEFTRAISVDPYYPDAYFNLGLVFEKEAQPDDAIGSFRTTIALDPQSSDAWTHIALLELKRRNVNAAMEAVERALAIDATNAEAMNLREAMRSRLGQ